MWGNGSRLAFQGQVIADDGRNLPRSAWKTDLQETVGQSVALEMRRCCLKWGSSGRRWQNSHCAKARSTNTSG